MQKSSLNVCPTSIKKCNVIKQRGVDRLKPTTYSIHFKLTNLTFFLCLFFSLKMSPISEFTNEIYDQDSLTDAFKEGADVWTVFLGVVVTLLPRVSQKWRHTPRAQSYNFDKLNLNDGMVLSSSSSFICILSNFKITIYMTLPKFSLNF